MFHARDQAVGKWAQMRPAKSLVSPRRCCQIPFPALVLKSQHRVDIFVKVWYLLWRPVDSTVSISGESLSADRFLVEAQGRALGGVGTAGREQPDPAVQRLAALGVLASNCWREGREQLPKDCVWAAQWRKRFPEHRCVWASGGCTWRRSGTGRVRLGPSFPPPPLCSKMLLYLLVK